MSIKIEASSSLVKKETPGCEVSKSDSIAHGYPVLTLNELEVKRFLM
jgi:hypothetical protein